MPSGHFLELPSTFPGVVFLELFVAARRPDVEEVAAVVGGASGL